MTDADYAELGIPNPSAPAPHFTLDDLIGRQFTMRVRKPDVLPCAEDYPDEREYKVALAQYFGVSRCEACGDETGECDCDQP